MDGGGQTAVDAVASVLHADHAASPSAGNHGNGFAGIAAQGKQEGIEFLIIGFDTNNGMLLTQGYVG